MLTHHRSARGGSGGGDASSANQLAGNTKLDTIASNIDDLSTAIQGQASSTSTATSTSDNQVTEIAAINAVTSKLNSGVAVTLPNGSVSNVPAKASDAAKFNLNVHSYNTGSGINAVNLRSVGVIIQAIDVVNTDTVITVVRIYNKANTVPVLTTDDASIFDRFIVLPGSSRTISFPYGMVMGTGFGYTVTNSLNDATSATNPANTVHINISYSLLQA